MYKSLFMDMEFTPEAQDAPHPFRGVCLNCLLGESKLMPYTKYQL